MARIAIIDSQITGISGDMLLSSLIDAGANKDKVINAILSCQNFLKGSKIIGAAFVKTISHGFSAMEFQFNYKDSYYDRRGMDMYRSLASCCDSLDLEQRAKTFALESLKTVIVAEALIHGQEISTVHLHEASGLDTFADLVGCAIALQDLNLFECQIFSTQVAIGGGVIKFSHGIIPNPSNMILEIFKNKTFTLVGGQVDEEITTPTGAAMLVNLTSETINYYPSFTPEKIGYGAGQKKFKDMANILRLIIGKSSLLVKSNTDTTYIIETNVDDISGEIIGNLIELLTEAGAKDVTAIPGISKKNRPTHLIRVISDQTQMNSILEMLFRESGSTGMRVQEIQRFILPRSIVTVPISICDKNFNIHVKIAKDTSGKTINIKPEFEDIKLIASRVGISVKRAMELTTAEVVQKLGRS
jgi:pyridinium-3,5-bisthiocarboxylic acid mononucleotide nickel chelatase